MWRKAGNESDDKQAVIEKSETSSSLNSDGVVLPKKGAREQLADIIHTRKFQIVVIVLVVTDCLLVIGELLIDLKAFEGNDADKISHEDDGHHEKSATTESTSEHQNASSVAAEVFHYCSIAILSIFLVELFAKLFAMGKSFFHHKMEIVDAIIVIVSFALDIAFIGEDDITSAASLLVILRLWRVGRIVNGIILSVKTQSEKKIAKEKGLREAAEAELVKFREYCAAQEREIEALQLLLAKHNIEFQKMEKPSLPLRTIDVVAEVNQYIEASRMVSSENDIKS